MEEWRVGSTEGFAIDQDNPLASSRPFDRGTLDKVGVCSHHSGSCARYVMLQEIDRSLRSVKPRCGTFLGLGGKGYIVPARYRLL